MFNDQQLDYSRINIQRMLRTVRGSIKKAIFYLGAKIAYSYSEDLVELSVSGLDNYLSNKGKKIKKFIDLDSKIRLCDDILDNQLAKVEPRPIEQMISVIKDFEQQVPEARDVAKLFLAELDIVNNSYSTDTVKQKIGELIEIRPSDFFVLVDHIVKDFGTVLKKEDYRNAWRFYLEFQRLRDLLDDIMSTEEDIVKKDYNSVVIAKQSGISYHFFEEIINNKFSNLKLFSQKIKDHPNKNIFDDSVYFWENQYHILFKRLLIDYYINLDEFKESYFMIKQL